MTHFDAGVFLACFHIDRLPQLIGLAEALGAERVELSNPQFYGWAFLNRAALPPTREPFG